jgi:hypothetical protein
MDVEIGTEVPIFLFWEYMFKILGILSLQCVPAAAGLYYSTKLFPENLAYNYKNLVRVTYLDLFLLIGCIPVSALISE